MPSERGIVAMHSKFYCALGAASLIPALASCGPTPGPAIGSPSPVLYLRETVPYEAGGQNWIRYHYDVLNKDQYPAALFAAAPNLPACGLNTNSSRTWVNFYDQAGTQLYGFCALGSPSARAGDLTEKPK